MDLQKCRLIKRYVLLTGFFKVIFVFLYTTLSVPQGSRTFRNITTNIPLPTYHLFFFATDLDVQFERGIAPSRSPLTFSPDNAVIDIFLLTFASTVSGRRHLVAGVHRSSDSQALLRRTHGLSITWLSDDVPTSPARWWRPADVLANLYTPNSKAKEVAGNQILHETDILHLSLRNTGSYWQFRTFICVFSTLSI